MDRSEKPPLDVQPNRRRIFTGTRGLLAFIVFMALGLGWFAHLYRQAERRTILLDELARSDMHDMLNEPTVVGQVIKKFWPGRESWVRGRIGSGWIDKPSIFKSGKIVDDQVAGIAQNIRELGTVREVHYDGERLSEAGIASLRDGLPGVNVVPYDLTELHHYFRSMMIGTHALYGPLWVMLGVAITLLVLFVLAARWLARQLRTLGSTYAATESGRP